MLKIKNALFFFPMARFLVAVISLVGGAALIALIATNGFEAAVIPFIVFLAVVTLCEALIYFTR